MCMGLSILTTCKTKTVKGWYYLYYQEKTPYFDKTKGTISFIKIIFKCKWVFVAIIHVLIPCLFYLSELTTTDILLIPNFRNWFGGNKNEEHFCIARRFYGVYIDLGNFLKSAFNTEIKRKFVDFPSYNNLPRTLTYHLLDVLAYLKHHRPTCPLD